MKRSTLFRYGAYVFSVGGARVAGLLITSLTFPFLVRHLGVQMYGLWSYVVALCAFLGTVSNPGLTTYAAQQIAARREEAFEIIADVLVLRLFSVLVAGAVLLAVATLERRADVRHLLYWYGIGILLVNLLGSDYLLTGLEMFHARSVLTLIQQALYAVGIFGFVRTPANVIWVPTSILASVIITNTLAWLLLWKRGVRFRFHIRPARWKGILVPSGHYALSALMSNVYHRTGHIVVRWMLDEQALGFYAAAARFVDIVRNFATIVLGIMMPRMALSAKSERDMMRFARFAVSVTALVSIPLMLGTIVTAPQLVQLVLGSQYAGAISLLRWMSPYLVTAPAASLLTGTMLYAMGRHRAYLASTVGGAMAGVLLYLTLIPIAGLKGAAVAYALAEFVVAAIAYASLPPDLRSLWKSPLVAVAAAAGLLMMATVGILTFRISQPFLLISAGALVYTLASGWFVKKWLVDEFGGLW